MSDTAVKPKIEQPKEEKRIKKAVKPPAPPLPKLTPKVDLRENETEYFISMELPGLKKKNVKVELNVESVTINTKKKAPKSLKKEQNNTTELEYGIFERTITLPSTVNPKGAIAKIRNGLFTIELPKKDYKKKRKIKVH